MIETLQEYYGNYPRRWKKHFETVDQVFTAFERVYLENNPSSVVPVIAALRMRRYDVLKDWKLGEMKDAVDDYHTEMTNNRDFSSPR